MSVLFHRRIDMADTHRGRFVWHELLTPDPEKAIAFYTKVIGWGTTEWPGPTPYTMWTSESTPVGGVMKPESAGVPPHWISYLGTPDVDATVAQASSLGAKALVPPTDIPDTGRFAVLTDPQGAVFAVYKSATDASAPAAKPKRGDFSWHELTTHDVPAAVRFYQELFGWQKTSAMDMGELGVYQMFGLNGTEMGGMYRKPADMPGPSAWLPYIMVGDLDRAVETTTSLGGQIATGPMEVPGGDRIAVGIDPQGAFFAMHEQKKA
jgi:uncharacterized protein